MNRQLLVLALLTSICSAQVYTFSVNPPVNNPFGMSTSLYQATFNAAIMMKFHGDCYNFWYTGPGHIGTPSYVGFHKQTGCTGSYVAYSGASQDMGGGTCSGGPAGTLFCDNVNGNNLRGCSLGVDTHNDKFVCFFFNYKSTTTTYLGLFVSTSSDGSTWSPPVAIPGHYWVGSGPGYMKGPTKYCTYTSGNHPTVGRGTVYELCTTDGITWFDDKLISNSEDTEGSVWYDAAGVNGLVVIRNAPPNPVHIGTTRDGGTTWIIVDSNIVGVTPACAISGGTLTQDSFPAPHLFVPTSPAGKLTLLISDRQLCTVGMNNYLLATTFDPMAVIANPLSLPPLQKLVSGPTTQAQVDFGYAGMLGQSGNAVTFSWYGDVSTASIRPTLWQMTGAYISVAVGSQVSSGVRWVSGATIR